MTQFIEGLDRQQTMLLPEYLDDYVDENSPVRAIDAFADMLDLAALGFNVLPAVTGRPGYHPGVDAADLSVRISQSSAVIASAGTRVRA